MRLEGKVALVTGALQGIVAGNVASLALKREATPEDLTGALVFLCSAESDFTTG